MIEDDPVENPFSPKADDLVVDALIAVLIALLLAVFTTSASGQAASAPTASAPVPDCLPKNSVFSGTGTDYGEFETAAVAGRMGWCPEIDNTWGLYVHQWCLKTVCGKAPLTTTAVLLGAIDRIRAAADPIAQVKLEWKTSGIPLATPLEVWQYNDWRYQACQWLTATQPGVTPRPSKMPIAIPKKLPTDIDPPLPPMNYCETWNPGPAPVTPPPPPGVAYVITSKAVYPVANGKRVYTQVAGAVGPVGTVVYEIAPYPIVDFGTKFCLVDIPGVAPPVVAGCAIKQTP